jgi:hypothetical protein
MQDASDDSQTPGRPVTAGDDLGLLEHETLPGGGGGGAAHQVDFTEARGKHLDMVLGVICQMRGASAATRRYCLCLTAAALPAALVTGQLACIVLMVGLALVFWLLDAGYARRQRLFERLYEEVRAEPADRRPDFRISVTSGGSDIATAIQTFLGGSRSVVYPVVIALLVVTGFRL